MPRDINAATNPDIVKTLDIVQEAPQCLDAARFA
jgi:hypothetical protein